MADIIVKKLGSSNSCIAKRHIVAIMGFIICTLLNIPRLVLGVAIVAMVKHKHASQNKVINSSQHYCPLELESKNTTRKFVGGELDWSTELQGYVLGVGFLGYIITQLPGGRWAETWGAKRTIVAGSMLTAVCTILTPMATWWHVYAVIGIQFLRGLGQGVFIPAVIVLAANWFPRSERGFLSTFVMSGFAVGAMIGGVVTGWLCDEPQFGWESAFYISGVYVAAVSIIFYLVISEIPQKHPTITQEELKHITEGQENDMSLERPPTPWKKILTSVSVYALSFGLFGQYWTSIYFLSVHPTYMGTILHFSMTGNGAASSIPISLKSVGGLVTSFFTSWITKNNYMGTTTLRKLCNSIAPRYNSLLYLGALVECCALGFSICLLVVYWAKCDHLINVICFSLSFFCSGIALSGAMIAGLDMSPRFSGSLTGLASTFASISTFFVPVLVGHLTKNQTIEEWHTVFILSIAIVLASGLIFLFFGSAEIQPWNNSDLQETSKALPEVPQCINKISLVTKL